MAYNQKKKKKTITGFEEKLLKMQKLTLKSTVT